MNHYRVILEVWPSEADQLPGYEGTGEHQQSERRTHKSYRSGEIEAVNESLAEYRKSECCWNVAKVVEVTKVYKHPQPERNGSEDD